VEKLTGKHVQATVPESFVKTADQIELVDAPPQESIAHTPDEVTDIEKRRQRLSKLRELALVLAADVVDFQLQQYLEQHGIRQHLGTHGRILVCITLRSNVPEMLETALTIAARFHCDLIAAYVDQPDISASDKAALDERLELARGVGAPSRFSKAPILRPPSWSSRGVRGSRNSSSATVSGPASARDYAATRWTG